MKMQNAEMEFVTFDAQDVIATSGPFVGDTMKVQIKTIWAYDQQYTSENERFFNRSGALNGLDPASNKQEKWLLYNADKGDLALRTAEGGATDDEPMGEYFKADTVELVRAWLTVQRTQQ